MPFPTNDTAVLIFSRQAQEEAKEKKFASRLGKRGGIGLANKMIDATLSAAHSSPFPVFIIFSDKQKGTSFGERLANGIEEVYSHGFSKVIVIGTDCPTLTTKNILEAGEKLCSHSLVLGPSPDGGTYLIGLDKEAYFREIFLQVPWLTDAVLSHLKNFALDSGFSFALEPLQKDLDNLSDVYQWRQHNSAHAISLFFNALLASVHQVYNIYLFQYHPQLFLDTSTLRGPPLTG